MIKNRKKYFKQYYYCKGKEKRMILYYLNRTTYLSDKKCVICKNTKNLEIDHINKKDKVSHKFWLWSKQRREEELKKCQVLCRKCHVEKTIRESSLSNDIHTASAYKTKRCLCFKCFDHYRISRIKSDLEYNQKRREKRRLLKISNAIITDRTGLKCKVGV
jgi:hypothetical protein